MSILPPLDDDTDVNAGATTNLSADPNSGIVPGWVCIAIGAGFIALVVAGIIGARMYSG